MIHYLVGIKTAHEYLRNPQSIVQKRQIFKTILALNKQVAKHFTIKR